jgi:hypothetical protein
MNRFVTPNEAAALSAPAVQRAMLRINEALCDGERTLCVLEALLADLCAGLRAASWIVEVGRRDGDFVWISVREREYSEAYLEQLGDTIAKRGER